jgi:uncharacterized protein (UPF0335 family)
MAENRGANSADARDYLSRIETLYAEISALRDDFSAESKERRDDIKSIFKEAEDHGVDPEILKMAIKYRVLERKQEAIRHEASADSGSRAVFDLLVGLGDDFAVESEKKPKHKDKTEEKDEDFFSSRDEDENDPHQPHA